jgi:hypothetical protein
MVRNYENLLLKNADDPRAQFEAAVAHRELGHLHHTQGDAVVARQECERAIVLLDSACAVRSDEVDYKRQLAWALWQRGMCDLTKGMPFLNRSVEVIRNVVRQSPDDWRYLEDWNNHRMFHAWAMETNGYRAEAMRLMRDVHDSLGTLANQYPANDELHVLFGFSKTRIALMLSDDGRISEALRATRKS